jgi:hypothetical protein
MSRARTGRRSPIGPGRTKAERSRPQFQSFQTFKMFQPPPLFLPRVAGEEGRGLNGAQRLNVLNDLNHGVNPNNKIKK